MKKFKFRLETLLNYRENEQRKALKDLEEVAFFIENLSEEINNIELEQESIEEEFKEASKKINPEGLQDFLSYLNYLRGKLSKKQEDRMRFQNILVQKQKVVLKARKKTKVLENLKNKQFTQWEEIKEKQERAFLDELSLTRYAKNQMDYKRKLL